VLASLAAVLMLIGTACQKAPPPPKLFSGGPLPIGEDVYLSPANYDFTLRAKPGDTYRVRAEWPNGDLQLHVGSDFRGPTGDDADDASNVQRVNGDPAGKYARQATLRVSEVADTAFIELRANGNGTGPLKLRVERGP
jgi:hypothetical protein